MVRSKPHFRLKADGSLEHIDGPAPTVSVRSLRSAPAAWVGQQSPAPTLNSIWDGEKFPGGYGVTQLLQTDYWSLRQRSAELFETNLYARGLIRRLVTNEINTGLTPEMYPDARILGVSEDALGDWADEVETRFGIWAKQPEICDWYQTLTFGQIQRAARAEALISGDVLVVLRMSQRTRLPAVQLISGNDVRTPFGVTPRRGHEIKHGVEFDSRGRVVAYWVRQAGGDGQRFPVRGEKTGRRMAWLVFGTDKRMDAVRGQPLLSLVLQSLKEIDRYRDSVQRKAALNAVLAMFIEKTEDKPSALPMSGGAVRRSEVQTTDSDGSGRTFNIQDQIPGMVLEELQHGEKPQGFHNQGTDEKFGEFESAILRAVAWANEVPPEILELSFTNNYSASQAAINEFKMYLNRVWADVGETICSPVMVEWLINETLLQRINSPGLLETWRDPSRYAEFGAWTTMEWYGSIKPSTDIVKQAKGSSELVRHAWSTNARESRINTGTKFDRNVKRLARENRQLTEAMRPLAEFRQEFGADPQEMATEAQTANALRLVHDRIDEMEESRDA